MLLFDFELGDPQTRPCLNNKKNSFRPKPKTSSFLETPVSLTNRRLNQPEKAAELAGRPMNEAQLSPVLRVQGLGDLGFRLQGVRFRGLL